MKPTYRDGDIIVVSPGTPIRRGDRVVVKTTGGRGDGQGTGNAEPPRRSNCSRSTRTMSTAPWRRPMSRGSRGSFGRASSSLVPLSF